MITKEENTSRESKIIEEISFSTQPNYSVLQYTGEGELLTFSEIRRHLSCHREVNIY